MICKLTNSRRPEPQPEPEPEPYVIICKVIIIIIFDQHLYPNACDHLKGYFDTSFIIKVAIFDQDQDDHYDPVNLGPSLS